MKTAAKSAESAQPRPVYSMTGFARRSGRVSDLLGFTLSLKSVNHRFLDLHLRLPSNTDALEMELRRELKARLSRGHVEVTLNLDRTTRNEVAYDASQVAAYVEIFRKAAAEHGLVCEPDLNEIFRMPGVFSENRGDRSQGERNLEEEAKAIETAVLADLPALVDALNEMRAREGSVLAAELRAGLDRLEASVGEAATLREDVQQAYFERIAQRLKAMVSEAFDPQRVLQEAALLAEKSDVEEEVARLKAHIGHFRELLAQGGEIGKKLDFLLQEMNREANTLLSKTGGVAGNGARVTEIGLGMKAEIEKAREQIQNLE
ncbi:YicC/YloC family endoribonuclease [Silvibacterium sp.]|uniref:YicC/YloC family endoribonuclease n=1 Tax=Silvibacterium sp. TaxID=1964179 RepID=UPI0039E5A16F